MVRRTSVTIAAVSAMACSTACSSDRSVLDTSSPEASRVATLGWALFLPAAGVCLLVLGMLVYGLVRRHRGPAPATDDGGGEGWMLGGGVILPVVVILPLVGFSVAVLDDEPDPAVQIEVIGHRWWWEYRYPDQGVWTANELHVPVGRPVELVLRSDDVIHSFWVPELSGKRDLVPGHENRLTFEAEEAGIYEGQCAEYCGLQHAKMRTLVIAQEPDDFERWLLEQRTPAEVDLSSEGAALFFSQGCAACHTIQGTPAESRLGPDLTHIASRLTLGAAVIANTPENLRFWIGHTWEVKEEIWMPDLPLTDEQVDAIASFLETLE